MFVISELRRSFLLIKVVFFLSYTGEIKVPGHKVQILKIFQRFSSNFIYNSYQRFLKCREEVWRQYGTELLFSMAM